MAFSKLLLNFYVEYLQSTLPGIIVCYPRSQILGMSFFISLTDPNFRNGIFHSRSHIHEVIDHTNAIRDELNGQTELSEIKRLITDVSFISSTV